MKLHKLGEETCKICQAVIPIAIFSERSESELKDDYQTIKDYIENMHWYNAHYNCAFCGRWIRSSERELLYGNLLNISFHKDYIPEKVGVERVHRKCLKKVIKLVQKNEI